MSFLFYISSCTTDDVFVGPGEETVDFTSFGVDYNNEGSLILISDVVTGFYDFLFLDDANIGFTVGSFGDAVSTTDLLVGFGGKTATLMSVSTFPSQVSVPLSTALSALGLSNSDLSVGDEFTFSFGDVSTASGTYKSGTSLAVPVSCSSNLGGTYDYVSTNLKAENGYPCPTGTVTGQVTFTDVGGGKYECSDLGFGQYGSSCWGDSPATSGDATFTDICNTITSGGLDQYGLVYIWVITDVSGPNLSMSWSNDYADGGDVVITRTDGSDWPPLVSN